MTRWIVHSRAEFTARHALTSYGGGPEEPHEHRWAVAIRVATSTLNDDGYALDFHRVHDLLAGPARLLDGTDLNAHPEIGAPSPTAERVAGFFADHLDGPCRDLGGTLLSVSVWEGPENRVDLEIGPPSGIR